MITGHTDTIVQRGHVNLVSRQLHDTSGDYFREIVVVPDVVVVAVYDSKQDVFIGLNQFRTPLMRFNTEFVAGGIDEGETPLIAAKRELAEELDLEASAWSELGTFTSSEGYTTESAVLFVAHGDITDVETDYVRKDEEAGIVMSFLPTSGFKFNGAKSQLAYELARKELGL